MLLFVLIKRNAGFHPVVTPTVPVIVIPHVSTFIRVPALKYGTNCFAKSDGLNFSPYSRRFLSIYCSYLFIICLLSLLALRLRAFFSVSTLERLPRPLRLLFRLALRLARAVARLRRAVLVAAHCAPPSAWRIAARAGFSTPFSYSFNCVKISRILPFGLLASR